MSENIPLHNQLEALIKERANLALALRELNELTERHQQLTDGARELRDAAYETWNGCNDRIVTFAIQHMHVDHPDVKTPQYTGITTSTVAEHEKTIGYTPLTYREEAHDTSES